MPDHASGPSAPIPLSVLHERIVGAAQCPSLRPTLPRRKSELLEAFAAYHHQLQFLPRRIRRKLQREWKRSLAGLALILALGAAPALAATIRVDDACTLARAIIAANNDLSKGGCNAGNGADTISLSARSTQALALNNNDSPDYGLTGLPIVHSTITIDGNGSTITRASGAPEFRILAVGKDGDLTLRETTVSGGAASGASVFGDKGGGLFNYGALTLINSILSGNTAGRGGGLYSTGPSLQDNNDVRLTNSTVSGNTASAGGGVFVGNYSRVNLTNSTVSGNTALRNGGGLFDFGYDGSSLILNNTTVSANIAADSGGGLYTQYSSNSNLTNATVTGNSAREGGGVFSNGFLRLARTLVSGNSAARGSEINTLGAVAAENYNLLGHSGFSSERAIVGFIPGATDITATAGGDTPTPLARILSTDLAENGGPTRTHALAPGSPALDRISGGACPPPDSDQRGASRPRDGDADDAATCDIGAFERAPAIDTVFCGLVAATIVGTEAGELVEGTPADDVIHGLAGDDVIRGLQGADTICGGRDDDRLIAGAGGDRLLGGDGADRLAGGAGADECNGNTPTRGDTAATCGRVSGVP